MAEQEQTTTTGGEPPATNKDQEKASKDQERHKRDIENDIKEGKEIAELVQKELKMSADKDAEVKLQAIGAELAEIANQAPVDVTWGDGRFNQFQYQFKLLEGDDVNAFSLPGGFIFFYDGLIKFAESDDEIAAVVAHEIAHASFRHMATLRREQAKMSWAALPAILAAAFSRNPEVISGTLTAASLTNQAFASGWSVDAEKSADYGAVQYMAKSRYNAVGMLTFMERLAFRDRFAPKIDWGIYASHPPSEQRASNILRQLAKYDIPVKRSAVTTTYSARSIPQENGYYELWFGNTKVYSFGGTDAKDRAALAVIALNNYLDSLPASYTIQTSGNELLGRGRVLFKGRPEDVVGRQISPEEAVRDARSALSHVIFDLSFRVWASPRG